MRFDWVKCRVRQHQFTIIFVPGVHNLADFFTKPVPVHNHVSLIPVYVTPSKLTKPASLSVTFSNRLISDSGATHVLLRHSSLPLLRHLFSPALLPSLCFSLPNGASLPVSGSDGDTLWFPNKIEPVECYVCDDDKLAHNLVGTSPILRPDGSAVYTSSFIGQVFLPVQYSAVFDRAQACPRGSLVPGRSSALRSSLPVRRMIFGALPRGLHWLHMFSSSPPCISSL